MKERRKSDRRKFYDLNHPKVRLGIERRKRKRRRTCAYCGDEYEAKNIPGPISPPPHTCSFGCREKEMQKPKWRQVA